MEKIVSLCKRRGIIFPSSDIYGGLSSIYDYGHLGTLIKNNVKSAWWKKTVLDREDILGLDSAVILAPKAWEASGHISSFSDPLVECKSCHLRFRHDHLKEGKYGKIKLKSGLYTCPNCGGELTEEKKFNLMFKTHIGPMEDSQSVCYLRPETAQGIFLNFKNYLSTYRVKLPFGIAQIGKAFRNEITPGNFTFRMREFEQMEVEYFVKPGEDEKYHKIWLEERLAWYTGLGISKAKLRLRKHAKDELSHYSKATYDIEYEFPWGWGELEGIANRTDYDLSQHQKFSGKDLSYFDEDSGKSFIPFVIEPSAGADRATLAFIIDSYRSENDRTYLNLSFDLAPVKAAVFPLVSNKEDLVQRARQVYKALKESYYTAWDARGNIGKRYFSQDEIGTPFCVTVDYDTLSDRTVTVRNRNTKKQERIREDKIAEYININKYSL